MTPKQSIDRITNSPEFSASAANWHRKQAALGCQGFTREQDDAYRSIRAQEQVQAWKTMIAQDIDRMTPANCKDVIPRLQTHINYIATQIEVA